MRPMVRTVIACTLLVAGCSKPLEPAEQLRVAAIGVGTTALADDGKHAIVGSTGHGISLWRIEDGERLFDWSHKKGADTAIVAADFSPDGKWAVTADVRTLALWNVQTGESLRFWQAPGSIASVQLGVDGNLALLGLADHTAVLFDARNGGIKQTFNHAAEVNSVAISDDGRVALTGSDDYSAVAWDTATGEPLHKLRHNDEVQLVALSTDGELALSVSQYDRALVWSTATGEAVGEVPLAGQGFSRGERFTAARFSADKQWLLTGQPNRLITLWRLPLPPTGGSATPRLVKHAQWQVPAKNPWQPSGATVLSVAFGAAPGGAAPGGAHPRQYFATASDGNVYWLLAPAL